jgi:predicted amidohydrolase
MSTPRKVAALPFDVRPGEVGQNLAVVMAAIEVAAAAQVGLLCLPEKWTTSFLPRYAAAEIEASEAALQSVHSQAEAAQITVVGSAPAGQGSSGKPYNQVHFLGAGGMRRPYAKRALFSPTGEGRQVARGEGLPPTLETPVGQVCAVVCYDLRFPEITRAAFYEQADFLLVPAQWPHPRTDIWELLCKARAAENQQWLLSCNRAGVAGLDGKHEMDFPGTALLMDPYGETEARCDDGELLVAQADLERSASCRKRVPCLRDLRMAGLGLGSAASDR